MANYREALISTNSRLIRIASPEGEVVRVSEPEGLFLRPNTPQPLRGSPPCRGTFLSL